MERLKMAWQEDEEIYHGGEKPFLAKGSFSRPQSLHVKVKWQCEVPKSAFFYYFIFGWYTEAVGKKSVFARKTR